MSRARPTSWVGCHTTCLTSCVWEFTTVRHSKSFSSSTVKHTGKEIIPMDIRQCTDQISCYELQCQTSEVVTHCSLTQTFPDPHTLVSATCCQQIPGRCPRHTFDLIFMSFQHGQTLEDKAKLWVNSTKVQHIQKILRLSISSNLKIIVLLFPDARGRIKAGRGQVIPAGRPSQFPHSALVSILKHTLTYPRVT